MSSPEKKATPRPISLEALVKKEHAILNNGGVESIRMATPSVSHEPSVRFVARDYFGLALSGGGIRSAIFNLGLLQALDAKGVLSSVDYLSTVSGGGYVGGFWSAWLLRQGHQSPPGQSTFPNEESNPSRSAGGLPDPREPAPIRHLREYSRFIVPRVGFRQFDTWNAVVTVLGGVLPSVVTSLCLLAFVFLISCRSAIFLEFGSSKTESAIIFAAVTVFVQVFFLSRRTKIERDDSWHEAWVSFTSALFSLGSWLLVLRFFIEAGTSGHFARLATAWHLGSTAFAPTFAWILASVVLLIIRAVVSRFRESSGRGSLSALIDRTASVCMAAAAVAAFMAVMWQLGRFLVSTPLTIAKSAGATTVAGSLLFSLRSWLTKKIGDSTGGSVGQWIASNLKPFIPRILSSLVVLGLVLISVLLSQYPLVEAHRRIAAAIFSGELIAALFLFNPLRVGMHDFYRRRIRDCFLVGARAGEKSADDGERDDPTLGILRKDLEMRLDANQKLAPEEPNGGARPIHLVCCTANNLAGDTLTSLYRGSRSAVLSPFGISLGGVTAELDSLRLSAALTASAAAFNSQMGQFSMAWGPAVAFAMSAFNLRLGLWVPHPNNPARRQFKYMPGLAFFYELLGWSSCDPEPFEQDSMGVPIESKGLGFVQRSRRRGRYLHLSDGGHFENLALYELIRRHCRYIIVSDCGADEDIKFDDLANAIRRVREDFGVQIEMDVEPLRPGADGCSVQHAVVGTIHYDGLYGSDKGTILYIKPTITGDEPADVLQHHSRFPHFPHDTTAEQFYDEAQWESYRALGEHIVRAVFSFLEKGQSDKARFVENLFLYAGNNWRPALPRQDEIYSALTEQCREVESDIRQNAPDWLRNEFFPEVAFALASGNEPRTRSPEEVTQVVYFLMVVIQIMEDVWVAAELDINWSHPMSEGWMNYFQRWTATPSFRSWWPILRPMYSDGLRDFVRDRFGIRLRDADAQVIGPPSPGATLKIGEGSVIGALKGHAINSWILARGAFANAEQPAIDYSLTLADGKSSFKPIQVAFVRYSTSKGGLAWHCDDLFVPHALVGGGIMARFLDRLIKYFGDQGCSHIEVTIGNGSDLRVPDRAARWAMVETINFYKSRGFVYVDCSNPRSGETVLRLELESKAVSRNQASHLN